ncbi:MAG: sulfotransferase domain-containing protein [Alphaproteobacteria bacterium]|nr:sulfotransferase domain-containing protein [Alphaproteobacteria bacterium]
MLRGLRKLAGVSTRDPVVPAVPDARGPGFIGIGGQKSGTTWLFSHLERHPGVSFPGGKEIHYWDWHYGRGIEWYRDLFRGAPAGTVPGDITPAYATLDQRMVEDVHRNFPDVRVIYLMRNPVERAWSGALHNLKISDMTSDEASDQWFIDVVQSRGSILRGDHERTLRTWRSVFPAESVLVETFEALKTEPRAVLGRVAAHIGFDTGPFDGLADQELSAPVHEGYGTPMRASLGPVLHELYRDRIASLSDYLGRDLNHWLEVCRPDTEPGPDRGFRPSSVSGSGLDGARPVLQAVLDACGTPARSLRVLDLAAGASGLAVEFGLQGATVVAFDRAPEVVGRLARACRDIAPDRMTCLEADVLALDLEALGEFDVVICLGLAGGIGAAEFAGLMRRVHVSTRRVVVVDNAAGPGGAGAAEEIDPTVLSGVLREAGCTSVFDLPLDAEPRTVMLGIRGRSVTVRSETSADEQVPCEKGSLQQS